MDPRGLYQKTGALGVLDPSFRPDEQRYRSNALARSYTRLENLWSELLVGYRDATNKWVGIDDHSVQWRKLLTGFSWTLNFCPYGESPYADTLPNHKYQKVNLNTCLGADFLNALTVAGNHILDGSAPLSTDQAKQFTANFVNYRSRQMNATDLLHYLRYRLSVLEQKPTPGVPAAPPADSHLCWGPNPNISLEPPPGTLWAWPAYVIAKGHVKANGDADETAYLEWLFDLWRQGGPQRQTFWAEIDAILVAPPAVATEALLWRL